MFRSPSRRLTSRRVLLAGLASLLATAACEREVLLDEAQPAGPSMVRERGRSAFVGPFDVAVMNEDGAMIGNQDNGDFPAQPYRWTHGGGLQLLPTLAGAEAQLVYDINNPGTAVGTVDPAGGGDDFRVAVWPAQGGVQVLPLPEGWHSAQGAAINDAGMIAGTASTADGDRVFRWTPQDGFEVLPPAWSPQNSPGAWYREHVMDMNASGDIIARVAEYCSNYRSPIPECLEEGSWAGAVLWTAAGATVVLANRTEDPATMPNDITDNGRIAGCVGFSPVVWTLDGTEQPIPTPGCAIAVNEAGAVAGTASQAWLWTPAGGVRQLGTMNGLSSHVADISESGKVTGTAQLADLTMRGFVWTELSGMQALPPLPGYVDSRGRALNEAGEVAGTSESNGGGEYVVTRWFDLVGNAAPVADAGGPYRGRISGRRYVYDASGSSDQDGVALRYSWDMNGDGAYEGVSNYPLFGHTYPAAGTYTIRLVVLDDGGKTDTVETTARVAQNVAPVISTLTGMPTSRGEGLPITLTPTVSDANQSVDSTELSLIRYRWEWGDGYTSAVRISTHSYADQGTYTVRLIVTDAGGLADTVTRTAVIGNLPPTGKLVAPTSIGEGTPFTISATAFTDAPADLAAGFTVAFNCGGGFGAYGSATSIVCPARPDQGNVTVRMRVKDKDGAASEATREIPVGNVAPRVTASATSPTTISAGGSFSVSATFTDVAGDAPWRYRIYWGDGAYTPLTGVAGGATIAGSHAYAAPGTYTVQVAVADKDGGSGRSAPITVTVTP
jgi:PKD repeat protein